LTRNSILDRKFRLLAVACGRRVEQHTPTEVGKAAIDIAEQFADRKATAIDLRASNRATWSAFRDHQNHPTSNALWTAAWVTEWKVINAASQAITGVEASKGKSAQVRSYLCEIIRDIFGDPFRAPPPLPASCLTPTVTSLATTIYDERAFARLPELADALAAAGCTEADVLAHCRSPGPHARGCWAVDLVLSKT
jgi:hypothetical protein